jgi:hypothetical protein
VKLSGTQAWGVLITGIVLIDLFAPEGHTLSEATYRARKSHPVLTYTAIGATVVHLCFGDHPSSALFDLFKIPARLLRATRKAILR